jgi:hypothetical protein
MSRVLVRNCGVVGTCRSCDHSLLFWLLLLTLAILSFTVGVATAFRLEAPIASTPAELPEPDHDHAPWPGVHPVLNPKRNR